MSHLRKNNSKPSNKILGNYNNKVTSGRKTNNFFEIPANPVGIGHAVNLVNNSTIQQPDLKVYKSIYEINAIACLEAIINEVDIIESYRPSRPNYDVRLYHKAIYGGTRQELGAARLSIYKNSRENFLNDYVMQMFADPDILFFRAYVDNGELPYLVTTDYFSTINRLYRDELSACTVVVSIPDDIKSWVSGMPHRSCCTLMFSQGLWFLTDGKKHKDTMITTCCDGLWTNLFLIDPEAAIDQKVNAQLIKDLALPCKTSPYNLQRLLASVIRSLNSAYRNRCDNLFVPEILGDLGTILRIMFIRYHYLYFRSYIGLIICCKGIHLGTDLKPLVHVESLKTLIDKPIYTSNSPNMPEDSIIINIDNEKENSRFEYTSDNKDQTELLNKANQGSSFNDPKRAIDKQIISSSVAVVTNITLSDGDESASIVLKKYSKIDTTKQGVINADSQDNKSVYDRSPDSRATFSDKLDTTNKEVKLVSDSDSIDLIDKHDESSTISDLQVLNKHNEIINSPSLTVDVTNSNPVIVQTVSVSDLIGPDASENVIADVDNESDANEELLHIDFVDDDVFSVDNEDAP